MKKALSASAALALGLAAAPASAETLSMQGVVAPFCNIGLVNASSGTASIAMQGTQQVANLRVSCNSATGTRVVLQASNGDLLSSANNRINYALELRSPSEPAFVITETDTNPGVPAQMTFTRTKSGFTPAIATSGGVNLELWLNMNVVSEAQAVGSSPLFPANAAPAGTYVETFTFTASSV